MTERFDRLEERLEEISARLVGLEREVAALRSGSGRSEIAEPPADSPLPESLPSAGGESAETWAFSSGLEELVERHGLVMLAGIASLILAGAMIIRIITLSSPVPLAAGAALGLVYCVVLLVVGDRMFSKGSHLQGNVFAIFAVLILGMLLVEVTLREDGFDRKTSYAILAVFFVLHSIRSIRRRSAVPFVIGVLAAPAAGLAIGGRPYLHHFAAGILVLSILAAAVGARRNGWKAARWGPFLIGFLYLLVLGVIAWSVARSDLPHHAWARPLPALLILTGFFVVLVVPGAVATLVRARRLDGYEITSVVAGALVVFAAAAGIVSGLPSGPLPVGVVGVVLALAFEAGALRSFRRHGAPSGEFYALSTIALVYAASSLPILLGGGAVLGLAYAALGLALAVVAARLENVSLTFQAIVLCQASFGVLLFSTVRISAPDAPRAPPLGEAAGAFLAGALIIAAFIALRTFRKEGEGFSLRNPGYRAAMRFLLLVAGAVLCYSGLVPFAFAAGESIAGIAPGEEAANALWNTIQTQFLALGGTAALLLGLRFRTNTVTLVAVGTMGLGGVKLFLSDLVRLPPAYGVGSAVVFGICLIVSSVFYRRFRGLRGEAGDPAEDADARDGSG